MRGDRVRQRVEVIAPFQRRDHPPAGVFLGEIAQPLA
jgi:hypothetical protein